MRLDDEPHSAAVLGDWRDGWWASDYLALLAGRLGLGQRRRALDVGCGKGHWARTLLPHLAPDATILGVDREPTWVAASETHAVERGSSRLSFQQASAESLPFADASFDLVTCQTLLMHVADPERVLAEMHRVLRPAGLVLLSEPTNLGLCLLRDSVSAAYAPARLARLAELHTFVAAGRHVLGEGDECIADRLPDLVSKAGFTDLVVLQNERVQSIFAPYNDAMRDALEPWPNLVRERRWLYDAAYAFRLFEAAGGTRPRFDELHAEFLEHADQCIRDLEAGVFSSLNGHNHHIFAARTAPDLGVGSDGARR